MKFYPADWRADPMLRVCSIGARGLWMELLSLMHESARYGHLLVNGKEPTDRQLSALVAVSATELPGLLSELEDAGVFSRDRNGAIYSRRMIRDEKKAEHARKVGKKGGNPTLAKQTGNSAQDNGADKPTVNGGVKAHKPEAREVEKERAPKPPTLPDDVAAILDAGGFAHPPGDVDLRKQWFAAGADLNDIVTVLRREAGKMKAKGMVARTLKIFDAPVREKLAADQSEIERLRRIGERNDLSRQPASSD